MRQLALFILLFGWVSHLPSVAASHEPTPVPETPDSDCTSAETVIRGVVSRVLDGDTADVFLEGDSKATRIRFYGIDAPEKGQPAGKEAMNFLADAIDGQSIDLIPTGQRTYGRIVGTLCFGDTSISREMVRRGYAWAYRQYLGGSEDDQEFCRLEAQARDQKRGIWALHPIDRIAPWEYRAISRNQGGLPTNFDGEKAENCIAALGTRHQSVAQSAIAHSDAPTRNATGCAIKGNINSRGRRIYHVPGSKSYSQTKIDESKGERWFCSELEAQAAGWQAPKSIKATPGGIGVVQR